MITIDQERCVGCGLCASDCVGNHIVITDGKAHTKTYGCIDCGHCYAICPCEAIQMKDMNTEDTGAYVDPSVLDDELLLQAMKSRRTIRQFTDRKVEKETLLKIIEAGRYAPTGANSQTLAFTVLDNTKDQAERLAVKLFSGVIHTAERLSGGRVNFPIDEHFFFKGAPVVVIVSAKNAVDGGLASSYMELLADSMGLGVLYSGFFLMALKLHPGLRRLVRIPSGRKPVTCMIMGYPAVKYQRIVPRKPAHIIEQ